MARSATSANPAHGLLPRTAAVALGQRCILPWASFTKTQGGKKVQQVIMNWVAHGRNVLLRHSREEKV